MKKLLVLCLIALIALTLPALAEGEECWQIFTVPAGAVDDFDGDENAEGVDFALEVDEYGDGSFALTVAGQTVTREYCMSLDGSLRAMKLGYGDTPYATLFMVSEYGPSDDPLTYCYLFEAGELRELNAIPAHAETFTVDEHGIISTEVRTDMLGTWFRPADYVLAHGYDWESEDYESTYALVEAPRDLYPMALIVDLKVDLPVRASRFDDEPAVVIPAGQKIAFTATDDSAWVFATTLDGDAKGWFRVRTEDYLHEVETQDGWMEEYDVFGNLLYAD